LSLRYFSRLQKNKCIICFSFSRYIFLRFEHLPMTFPNKFNIYFVLVLSSIKLVKSYVAGNCGTYLTVRSGETCDLVVQNYNIPSLSSFLAANPGLTYAECPNIYIGQKLCITAGNGNVFVPPFGRGLTFLDDLNNANTGKNNDPLVPTPSTNCGTYILVQSGDYCGKIVTKYNIASLDALFSVNKGLSLTSCPNIQVGQKYCLTAGTANKYIDPNTVVAGTGNNKPDLPAITCSKYTSVKSGDTFDSIYMNAGLTMLQFITLNPDLACYMVYLDQKM
jgi:LysM repeat protein